MTGVSTVTFSIFYPSHFFKSHFQSLSSIHDLLIARRFNVAEMDVFLVFFPVVDTGADKEK